MSTGSDGEERGWAADKRDFVADWRDTIADQRDRLADDRERFADAREAELDDRERQLHARDAEAGRPADAAGAFARAAAETRARLSRERHDRDDQRAARTMAAADRDAATTRRLADLPPTRLAMVFAEIAEQLYDADTVDIVFRRIAEAAVSTVEGCRMASITLAEGTGYRTAASTDPAATSVDQTQYDAHEGPGLDALDAPMVYAPSFPDERWPHLAARPTEFGVQSALSHHLIATGTGTARHGGSLNSYGDMPDAFNDAAQEIGFILAAHASLAARAVHERSTLHTLSRDLQQALLSRDVIGQAKGILMERRKITPEDAFDLLRRSSQLLNVKLRDLAREIAETGEVPVTKSPRPTGRRGVKPWS